MSSLNPIYQKQFKELSKIYGGKDNGQYLMFDTDAICGRIQAEQKLRGINNGTINRAMRNSGEKFPKLFSYYMNTYTTTSKETVMLPSKHFVFLCREFDISPQELLFQERGNIWLPRKVSTLVETLVAEPEKDAIIPKLYYAGVKLLETYPLEIRNWNEFFFTRLGELDEGIDGGINRVMNMNKLYRIKARMETITADSDVRVQLPATIAAYLDQSVDFFMIPDYTAHNDIYIIRMTKDKEKLIKIVNTAILDIISIYLRLSQEGQLEFNKLMLHEILSAHKTEPSVLVDII